MIRIPLSISGPKEAFDVAVELHRLAVEKHRIGKPGIYAPVASELIASLISCVPDTGPVAQRGPDRIVTLDYEIFDDTPPVPELTLEQRKMQLFAALHEAAQAAKNAILSPARANLMMLDAGAAMGKPEESRTPAESAALAIYTQFSGASADIDRAVAVAMIDIEDLTNLTIDGWKTPSF